MSLYLCHHGIKGQKWGVRRYQNPDGTLTQAGKDRAYINKTNKYVEDIESSLSYDDRKRLGYENPERTTSVKDQSIHTVKRFVNKYGDIPVGYFEIQEYEDDYGKYQNALIAVRSGDEYRNKGIAKDLTKQGMEYFKNQLNSDSIFWTYRSDNIASEKLSKSNGFKYLNKGDYTDEKGQTWKNNIYRKDGTYNLTTNSLRPYINDYKTARRLDTDNKNTMGKMILKDNKLVGAVNVETKDNGEKWIQGLEVYGDNKGKGYGKQLLKTAINDLGATHLSVRKTNNVAKSLYDKNNFEIYDEDDYMYYMKLKK